MTHDTNCVGTTKREGFVELKHLLGERSLPLTVWEAGDYAARLLLARETAEVAGLLPEDHELSEAELAAYRSYVATPGVLDLEALPEGVQVVAFESPKNWDPRVTEHVASLAVSELRG